MKALTVCQPWASLIAAGIKRVENRRWATDYRGPLLIHAGANRTMYEPDPRVPDAPYSMIVARCELVGIVDARYNRPVGQIDGDLLRLIGNTIETIRQEEFIEGPYCWILANIQPLAIPFAKGERGLFEIDLDAAIANGPAVAAMLERRNGPKPTRPTRAEIKAQQEAEQLAEWNRRHTA